MSALKPSWQTFYRSRAKRRVPSVRTVRITLADYEQVFRAQEVNKRMKERAVHACRALSRVRVVEEIRLRKGTTTAEHLKLVLEVIDGPRFP
jgi:hypothetical protein